MQQNMAYILLIIALSFSVFGIQNIRRNLKKNIPYDFWGDFRRSFLKLRMRYGHHQKAEDCNLIMPGIQTLVGVVLLGLSLFRLFKLS